MSRNPCPSKKRGYPDQMRAIAAAVRVSRNLGPLRIYDCPHCGLLHLTRLKVWVER
jgi:hypothetical protein